MRTLIVDGVKYNLCVPKDERELELAIQEHSKDIFGEKSIYFNTKAKLKSFTGLSSIPDGFVVVYKDPPTWHIVEVELSTHPYFDHIHNQVSKFISSIGDVGNQRNIAEKMDDEIGKNSLDRFSLQNVIGQETHKWLTNLTQKEPMVTIILETHVPALKDKLARDLRYNRVQVIEFLTYERSGVGIKVHAHVFQPLYETTIPSVIVSTTGEETKQEMERKITRHLYSSEEGDLQDAELTKRLTETLQRKGILWPRLIAFLEVISSEQRQFQREEIKDKLYEKGIGKTPGQAGIFVSNISQFIGKPSNKYLRQVIDFTKEAKRGTAGQKKETYQVVPKYRQLLRSVLMRVGS